MQMSGGLPMMHAPFGQPLPFYPPHPGMAKPGLVAGLPLGGYYAQPMQAAGQGAPPPGRGFFQQAPQQPPGQPPSGYGPRQGGPGRGAGTQPGPRGPPPASYAGSYGAPRGGRRDSGGNSGPGSSAHS